MNRIMEGSGIRIPLRFERADIIMKKINGFQITKMTLSGFKCFEEEASFTFGDTTYITASNGKGKSSIADAAAFAFAGTPFFGEKGLDRLQNKEMDEMTVSVDIVDDTGRPHHLTRTRKRDSTLISYDGTTVRQSDLNTAFGGRDIFLSILNPLYFISVLGDGGKNLLEKLLPAVKQEDVLASLPKCSQEVLAGQSLLSPETFIKNRRCELKKLNEALISYQGKKELVEQQREERAGKLEELRITVENISKEMEELMEVRDKGRNPDEEKALLAQLHKQRESLLAECTDNKTDEAIRQLAEDIKSIEKSMAKQEAEPYVSSYMEQMAETEARLKNLYTEHKKVESALRHTKVGYRCPVCMSVITDENIVSVREDMQQRLSALVHDGRNIKKSLSEMKARDSTARDMFERHKTAVLEKKKEELADLNQRLQERNVARELDREDYAERVSELENQISETEKWISDGNWSQEQAVRFAGLCEKKKSCEAQIEAFHSVEDDDYTALIEETETEVLRVKRLINEAIQYMANRIELMLGGIKMSSTEIVLTELVKTTGEIKDCFRFSYEGKDYKCLSLAERVRAGLDVSVLIRKLSGRNYPIFVDNSESICTFGKVPISGQVILARVANGQELQVTYRNHRQMEAA